jgi:hypothetical protein
MKAEVVESIPSAGEALRVCKDQGDWEDKMKAKAVKDKRPRNMIGSAGINKGGQVHGCSIFQLDGGCTQGGVMV